MKAELEESAIISADVAPSSSWRGRWKTASSSELAIWFGLTALFVSLPLFCIRFAFMNDPDIWWHMRAGEWMLQNHRFLRVDPFSASTLGRPWVDYSWLWDIFAFRVVTHFDLVSLLWYQIVMRLALTAAVFSLLRSLMPQFWRATALTALGMLAMAPVFPPRPGVFSVLFFVLELHVLLSWRRSGKTKLLWVIPVLFAVWANVHIEFITGLFLLGLLCLEPVLERMMRLPPEMRGQSEKQNRQLWLLLAVSILATLVNPYGWGLFRTVFQYAHDSGVYDIIIELRAMNFRAINDWAVLGLLMMGCFALGRLRPFRPAWALLLGWSAWMGFRSIREVWLVTIISLAIIAISKAETAHQDESSAKTSLQMRLAVISSVVVILVAAAAIWGMTSNALLAGVRQSYPVDAVKYIRKNHLQGPILNEFSWGGFLIYSLPDMPVAMDGRTNIHSQAEIQDAISLWNAEPGWQNRPELRNANLVISNRVWTLVGLLRNDPHFRIVYEDPATVLFQAVHPTQNATAASQKR